MRLLLDDPVPRVRRAALHSISSDACKVSALPNRENLSTKVIDMALNDSSIRVRRVAADSLAESGDQRAVAVLKQLFEEDASLLQKTARDMLMRSMHG